MQRSMSKAERLREMERLYFQRAYSDIEMGERLGVDRTTVYRHRIELEREVPFIQDQDGRWTIDRTRYLSSIRVNLSEALSLYLAARRTSQQTRFAQRHVATALEKLALTLRQPLTERLVRAADRILAQRQDVTRAAVFETVAAAWIEGRRVRLVYRALGREAERVHRFAPYLLEPSPWNDGIYLIGQSDLTSQVLTLKLDRIVEAKLLGPFEPPADFDEEAMLRHAWGIWGSEQTPHTVKLRFAPGLATRRLRETIWHPLESVTDLEDGGCVWEAPIAEWQEMLPWIRGWGADCEVLEPVELRMALIEEAHRLYELYQINSVQPDAVRLLWAKAKTEQIHPLFCHLIDVGQVALALWNDVLTCSFRSRIAESLGVNLHEAGQLFAFWTACHDLGKASPNFQRKYEPMISQLESAGFVFPMLVGKNRCYHATISALILPDLLGSETGLPYDIGLEVAQALGGHHGSWPIAQELELHQGQIGDAAWQSAQRALVQMMVEVFQPPHIQAIGDSQHERNVILTLLSGFTSVVDWLGSMDEFFPYAPVHINPVEYSQVSAQRARRVLQKLGWTAWQPPQTPLTFQDLHHMTPRPAQETIINLSPGDEAPTLVIVEVPTGVGKTELALYLADRWAALRQQRGLYVAMPTQATSNQMWERVGRFLQKRYPDHQINYHLIHSGARWKDDLPSLTLQTTDDGQVGTLAAMSWFLPRKRTLLAPFAVGTVDQALLSVLQTRHFFVRLFGLAGKTVIFDEVHAYDTYMNTLFQQLLTWLRAVGTSVIVLSATLPAATRRALVEAYIGEGSNEEALTNAPYPAVTIASGAEVIIERLPAGDARTIMVDWIGNRPESIVDALRARLQDGGCAAVICNRVARAQELYMALRDASIVPDDELLLFHARTPAVWRDQTEEAVLHRFGKEGSQRPAKSIVVATQVIEQSLDLDFDLIITDLAPVDLVLQRAGRLHRHQRDNRPASLKHLQLLITQPIIEDGLPVFGRDQWVYEPYILLRSYIALRDAGMHLRLPEETVTRIEMVYGERTNLPGDLSPALLEMLDTLEQEMADNERKARQAAHRRLILAPQSEDLIWQRNELLAEDSPEVHGALQALTRLIGPSISLVCLHCVDGGLALDPGGAPAVDLAKKPTEDLVKKLAQRVISVQHQALLRHFAQHDVPPGWQDHALLHDHRAVVFNDGVYEMEGTNIALHLTQELGLVISTQQL